MNSGSPNGPKPIVENKYISDDILQQLRNLSALSECLSLQLNNRLSKVSRKFSDCGDGDCKAELTKKDEDYPEYFSEVRSELNFITTNFNKIQDLISRLEI